ncbi:DExH-box ATP-dependent RNA helicase DExH8 isoform X1 [Primulina tabacum]|uniref:DExH-box ATP-dependent RNA helicase DExH8 isoform X1 n=2 Tax=Primulina tabacum TaxID=48773 RepID=UPI003F5A9D66
MTSSPTFSSACSSTDDNFSGLPIMALRSKIIDKIMENRVTLIVGETGCGKSSQVPQFLLEANMEPILCTQPRRFAVVAVARMVARARNCEVGGEIGFHIGHSRVFSARSKIIFKTAGVLLDEMLEKGLKALKYKVIILDEVHERSVESDLVLVCVKQFLLKNSDLRLVLMSATADISRYREYFRDLGRGERVEVLAIPPGSGKVTMFQHKVSYLEQIMELLGMKSENLSLEYCSGSSPMMAMADLKPEVHKLIHNLVLQIHNNEADIEKSILVFLPTYYALEQQWFILKPFSDLFKVHILHRSVDTEQALKAMRIWKSHRKIMLATNMAESSVTIPKVGYVIDSCRSLQVFWDNNRKTDSAELVWVSKSQADQRKGRTGRTCDGHVYRLVTGSFYGQLDDFESPAILKLSLRQQVLLICCAESKSINDPKALLQKAMDPPDRDVIDDALDLLVHMHALEKASRGRHEPTFYGRLLASFSLSFDASVLILKFGSKGMLREGILLGILMDLQPLPILHPFGREHRFLEYTCNYYNGDNKNIGLGKKEALCMGNLCAYEFWQRVFKDKCRLDQVKNIWKIDEVEDKTISISKMEEEWCSFHNLVKPALQQVTETYEEILNSLHRFRPMVLVISNNLPPYYEPYDFRHTCHLKCKQSDDIDALDFDDEHVDLDGESRMCTAVPFVGSKDFQTDIVARIFASIVKEMRIQLTQDPSSEQKISSYGNERYVDRGVSLCRFFASGLCNRGSHCLFSHSLQAKKPVCKFFFSLQGCRNGGSCYFSHDSDSLAISDHESGSYCQEDEGSDMESLMRYFPSSSEGYLLVLDDIDLHFSSYICQYIDASRVISTTSETNPSILHPSLKVTNILCGLSHPYETILFKAGHSEVPWNEVKCVLWFPIIDSEYGDEQKHLMQNFFIYMAIRLLADALHEVQVILTMNNIRFSQIQVEPIARDSFFFLEDSFPFDESSFGELFDVVTVKRPLLVSKPVSYVFKLHPPTDIQYGNYRTLLRQHLYI